MTAAENEIRPVSPSFSGALEFARNQLPVCQPRKARYVPALLGTFARQADLYIAALEDGRTQLPRWERMLCP